MSPTIYGSAAPAITATRGIPLPTAPRSRDDDHITARLERQRNFVSPIRLHNPAPLTREQLEAAGYTIVGTKPTRSSAPRTRLDVKTVARLYTDGATTRDITARYGTTVRTVRHALHGAGITLGRDRSGPRKVDRDELLRLRSLGHTQREIAALVGASTQTVARNLRDLGHGGTQIRAARPRVNIDGILADYRAGVPIDDIAATHQCSHATVHAHARKAGLSRANGRPATPKPTPTRTPSGRPRGPKPAVDDTDVQARYLAGSTVPTIARDLHVNIRTINRSLTRTATPRRDDRKGHSGGYNAHPETTLRAAADLYATGLTRTQVAERLGIGVRAVDKGIALVGARPRPGVDHATHLRDLMAANNVDAADVRAWAHATGRDCPARGIPPRPLVETYLLEAHHRTSKEQTA